MPKLITEDSDTQDMTEVTHNVYLKNIIFLLVAVFMQSCNPFNNHSSEVQLAPEAPAYPDCSNDFLGSCVINSATKAGVEPNLLATNIVSGVSIFGVAGTAVILSPCTNDNVGSCRITQANKTLLEPNLVAGNIRTGTMVFGVTGTLPAYAACINNNSGNCAIPGANKTGIEPNLLATNIMNGVTVFGVTGTYQGPSLRKLKNFGTLTDFLTQNKAAELPV